MLHLSLELKSCYFFNGRRVCVRFLCKSSAFSSELIVEEPVTTLPSAAHQNACPGSHENPMSFTTENFGFTSCTDTYSRNSKSCAQRDAVVFFLTRLWEDCSDRMPDNSKPHLLFFQIHEFFLRFIDKFNLFYFAKNLPSYSYFPRFLETVLSANQST